MKTAWKSESVSVMSVLPSDRLASLLFRRGRNGCLGISGSEVEVVVSVEREGGLGG